MSRGYENMALRSDRDCTLRRSTVEIKAIKGKVHTEKQATISEIRREQDCYTTRDQEV